MVPPRATSSAVTSTVWRGRWTRAAARPPREHTAAHSMWWSLLALLALDVFVQYILCARSPRSRCRRAAAETCFDGAPAHFWRFFDEDVFPLSSPTR